MKKVILFVFVLSLGSSLNAQDSTAFKNYLLETLSLYDSVKTLDDYVEIVNRMERMTAAQPEEWLPHYYVGLTYIYMSFVSGLESDLRDDYVDNALAAIDKAESMQGETPEIVVLRGYAYMAKVSVSPAIRGITLSAKVSGYFEKALAMDPQNPRANLMAGRWKYGTAQFFGSSTSEACALMARALSIYEQEDATPKIKPAWGANQARAMAKRCEGKK